MHQELGHLLAAWQIPHAAANHAGPAPNDGAVSTKHRFMITVITPTTQSRNRQPWFKMRELQLLIDKKTPMIIQAQSCVPSLYCHCQEQEWLQCIRACTFLAMDSYRTTQGKKRQDASIPHTHAHEVLTTSLGCHTQHACILQQHMSIDHRLVSLSQDHSSRNTSCRTGGAGCRTRESDSLPAGPSIVGGP